MSRLLIPVVLVIASIAPAFADTSRRVDIFSLSSGAVLVSNTPFYGEGWEPLLVIDSNAQTGWSSPNKQTGGNIFVIELARVYNLQSIALDNSNSQESQHPGISARAVEVWVSITSPSSGFSKVATLEAPKGARKEFPIKAIEAKWVKLVITNNWGDPEYTELMEIEGYGDPAGPPPQSLPPINGVFQTNYGPMRLVQQGTSVSGCYYAGDGILQGATDGRVVNLAWRQGKDKSRSGSAVMVLNAAGDYLNGVWYEGGREKGTWAGARKANAPNPCTGSDSLAADLQQSGRAVVYGINFASDSAKVSADSAEALNRVLAVMQSHPALRFRIEGYTDSTNTDQYNLDLSKRRAQAIVAWLVEHGIVADRLRSEGYGKNNPVADNDTPQGRSLNRRVEVSLVK
jgi:outer membrane protein OmpA-like peptidoglycan-associated protein